MIRQVVTSKNIDVVKSQLPAKQRAEVKPDNYLTKIVKYIPSEVVTLYVTLYGIASAAAADIPFVEVSWLIVGVGVIGTVLYLYRVHKVKDWLQIGISTGAFVVWVFALGGPFTALSWYHPVYGALLLPIYTFSIPVVVGE